jgi:DNA-binding transcriptional ArsR family regulator
VDEVERAAQVAQALSNPVRLALLVRLLEGPATVSELTSVVGQSQSLVSNHLAYLREREVVVNERRGRQVAYRLRDANLADVVEALSAYVGLAGASRPDLATQDPLFRARTCYDHLAGALGVQLFSALVRMGAIREQSRPGAAVKLGPEAESAFRRLGVDLEEARNRRRRFAYACLDWTERRPHLGGALGAALCQRLFDLGWMRQSDEGRAVELTEEGQQGLGSQLDLAAPR